MTNGATWNTGGEYNGAVTCDGVDSYVSVTSTNALKYTGAELTLSTWVYVNSTETNGAYLISKPWNTSTGQFNYGLSINGSRNVIFSLQGTSTSYTLTSSGAISTGAWHHVAATVDSSKATKLYIDGALVNSGAHTITTWTPTDSNRPLVIGSKYNNAAGSYGSTTLDGRLDNVRVYDQALTLDEIKTLAIDPPTLSSSGLRGATPATRPSFATTNEPAIGKLPTYVILVGEALQRSTSISTDTISSVRRADAGISWQADRVDTVLRGDRYAPLNNKSVMPFGSRVGAALAAIEAKHSALSWDGPIESLLDRLTFRSQGLKDTKVLTAVDAYFRCWS